MPARQRRSEWQNARVAPAAERQMFSAALIFLAAAFMAAFAAFGGMIAATFVDTARILFYAFLISFFVAFVAGLVRNP
jgi:uncharacterized membrane protein YtjA (UPF0391 family)